MFCVGDGFVVTHVSDCFVENPTNLVESPTELVVTHPIGVDLVFE